MKKYLFGFLLFGFGLIMIPTSSEAATTTTIKIYPTDDGLTQLYDNDNITTWSAARNYTGTVLTAPNTTSDQIATRGDKHSGKYRIYRTSAVFDTSVIPDDATVTDASFYGYKGYSNNHGQQLVITAHTRASSTQLAKGDWNLTNYGAEFARGGLIDNQYKQFSFNSSGKNYINPEGYTVIGGMQDNDFDNIDIGYTQSGATIYSSDASGTSTDPYLEVTYVVEPTTIKIYPTDDGTSQLYDDDNQTDWTSARNFSGTLYRSPDTTSDQLVTRGDRHSGKYRIYRTSTVFDTGIIPDDATIVSASMFAYKGYSNNHGQQLVLTAHTRASSTSLAKGDWQLSNYGAEFSRGSLITGQYKDFDFNSTGVNYINPEGYTIIGGMQDNDFDNVNINWTQSGTAFYSSEATGTSTDPYLEVTYYDYLD